MTRTGSKPLHLLIDGDQISAAGMPAILQALFDNQYHIAWPAYVFCNEKADMWEGVMPAEQLELSIVPQMKDAADIAITLQAGRLIELGAERIAIASTDRLFLTAFELFKSYGIEAIAVCPARNIMRKQLAIHADHCVLFNNVKDHARGAPSGVAKPPAQEPKATDLRTLLEQLCSGDDMVELQVVGDYASQLGITYSASLSKQIQRMEGWTIQKSHRVLYARQVRVTVAD